MSCENSSVYPDWKLCVKRGGFISWPRNCAASKSLGETICAAEGKERRMALP